MKLRSVRALKVKNKRVLVRASTNVPTDPHGKVTDDWRLRRSLPTIRWLVQRQAKVVLMGHRGRPEGKPHSKYSLRPVAKRLAAILKYPIHFVPASVGPLAEKAVAALRPGGVLMLENLRFDPGEKAGRPVFARRLAKLGDAYVNDAFENAHRADASMVAITRYLPSAAGLLMEEEVTTLHRALTKPRRPLVTVIGGAKISTKIGLLKSLLPRVDYLLLGGALANVVLKVQGLQVGRSLIENKVEGLVRKIHLADVKLKIPIDVMVAPAISARAPIVRRAVGRVGKKEIILDIGRDTVDLFTAIIESAGTVIWNGPMGYSELPAFAKGTHVLAHAIVSAECESILGGGETIQAVRRIGLLPKFSFVSTGGGAMLEFIEKGTLPALRPLTVE